jgi:hypothetical protein
MPDPNCSPRVRRARRRVGGPRPAFSVLLVALIGLACTYISFGDAPTVRAATLDVSTTPVKFVYSATDPLTGLANPNGRSNGDRVIYRNVTSVGGLAVDAVVTTTLSGASLTSYDPDSGGAVSQAAIAGTVEPEAFQANISTSAADGATWFQFDFYEAGSYTSVGSGIPVVLRNVTVASLDLDTNQFSDLASFQTYTVTSSPATMLSRSQSSSGVARFVGSVSGNNEAHSRVVATYDSLSTFQVSFGVTQSGRTGSFGVLFLPDPWAGCSCTKVTTNNPYNRAPTSTDDSRNVVAGVPTALEVADFGPFADADSNPFHAVRVATLPAAGSLERFVSGAWQSVTAGELIPTAEIDTGMLRYTTTTPSSFTFHVNDFLVDSTAAYTLSFGVSAQSQTISFASPGAKLPGTTFASGATASSGLTVTLTTLTPGICTVSGLSITTVAAGSCTIEANQAGDASYGAAAPVSQTFSVSTKTSQTITFPDPGPQTYSGSSFNLPSNATASSGLTVSLASLTVDTCTVSGLSITVIATGSCSVRASQAGDATYAAASPVEQTFLVSAPAPATTTTTTTTTIAPTTTVADTTTTVADTTTTVADTTTTVADTTTTAAPSTTAAPTTTVPAPTTTVPAPPPSGGPGALSGTVWFDADRDGQRDADEPALPGMLVTVSAAATGVASLAAESGSVGAADIVPIVRTAVTDQRGGYSFADLGAGRYQVELSAPAGSAADPSWMAPSGTWRAPVDVAPSQVAKVDFAAAGSGSTAGIVVDGGGALVPQAEVTCTWVGLDERFGTADDVPFETASDGGGAFQFEAVPVGEMACWAIDVRTGTSTSSVVAVASPSAVEPAWVVLQFGGPSAVGTSPTLPATGGAVLPLVRAALVLMIAGSVTVLVTRRRRPAWV